MWETIMNALHSEVPDWVVVVLIGLFVGVVVGMVSSR